MPPLQLLSFSLEETLSPPAAFELPTKNKKHKEKKNTLGLRTILPATHGGPTTDSTDLHCTILLALSHFGSLYCFFKGDSCFSQTYHSVSIKLLQFSVLLYQRCPVFLPLLCQANKSLCTGINHTLNDKNKVCEVRVLKPPLLHSTENSAKIFKEKKAMPQNMCIDPLLPWQVLHGEKNISIWNISLKLKRYVRSFNKITWPPIMHVLRIGNTRPGSFSIGMFDITMWVPGKTHNITFQFLPQCCKTGCRLLLPILP